MNSDQSEGGSLKFLGILLVLVFAIWVLWALSVATLTRWFGGDPTKIENLGQFGDLFGGVNALFTAAALAVLLWAGWMQRAELHHQRKEFALQRDEMRNSQAIVARQNFESTFFRMLELLRELQARISIVGKHGDEALKIMRNNIVQNALEMRITTNIRSEIGHHMEHFIFGHSRDTLGPYFRTLYHTLKLIDETPSLDTSERARFSNIVRSQLSSSMVVIIAANGCNDTLSSSMQPLISKYRILKHIDADEGFLEIIRNCYPRTTFLGREFN